MSLVETRWRNAPSRTLTDGSLGAFVLGTLGVAITLALWEVASRLGVVASTDVPPASDVLVELARLVPERAFWDAVGATMSQWAIGMVLSAGIAIPLGLLMGSVEAVWRAFRPLVEFLRPVPGMALVPLTVLLWGISGTSVLALIVFGCIWSLIVLSMYGAHDVDVGARDTARAFGLTAGQRAVWLVLPSALPYIATGLRVTSATALIIAVGGELVIAVTGLGHDIALAQTAGAVTTMYALILASGVLGIAIHLAFTRLERHFLRWHQSQRRAVGA
jgi:ABC-type nitrate/sulfonate/bicarbonate transport system permease component